MIAARKALALSDGDMVLYRVLHASCSWLLDGCDVDVPEPEAFEDWMRAMRFETTSDSVRVPPQACFA